MPGTEKKLRKGKIEKGERTKRETEGRKKEYEHCVGEEMGEKRETAEEGGKKVRT